MKLTDLQYNNNEILEELKYLLDHSIGVTCYEKLFVQTPDSIPEIIVTITLIPKKGEF